MTIAAIAAIVWVVESGVELVVELVAFRLVRLPPEPTWLEFGRPEIVSVEHSEVLRVALAQVEQAWVGVPEQVVAQALVEVRREVEILVYE